MSSFKRPFNQKSIGLALKRLEQEAEENGRSLREQLGIAVNRYWKTQHARSGDEALQFRALPMEFFRELVNLSAGKSKRTPGQQIKKALQPWAANENPKQLQNWYGQIYGEFANESLSEVMREVLIYGLKKSGKLMQRVHSAILRGDVKVLGQITRCVALIHGVRHEGTGQAARVASENKRKIGFSYLRLFEIGQKPPTPADIRVELARDQCHEIRQGKPPRFSDIWYLLRSGSTDDEDGAGTQSRYEVVGTRYIKKVIKSLKWPLRSSLRGPITVKMVKVILDKIGRDYLDDSRTILESLN